MKGSIRGSDAVVRRLFSVSAFRTSGVPVVGFPLWFNPTRPLIFTSQEATCSIISKRFSFDGLRENWWCALSQTIVAHSFLPVDREKCKMLFMKKTSKNCIEECLKSFCSLWNYLFRQFHDTMTLHTYRKFPAAHNTYRFTSENSWGCIYDRRIRTRSTVAVLSKTFLIPTVVSHGAAQPTLCFFLPTPLPPLCVCDT